MTRFHRLAFVLTVFLKMALNFPYTHLFLPVAGITEVQAHIWRQAALGIKLRASGTVNKLSANRATYPETKKSVFYLGVLFY